MLVVFCNFGEENLKLELFSLFRELRPALSLVQIFLLSNYFFSYFGTYNLFLSSSSDYPLKASKRRSIFLITPSSVSPSLFLLNYFFEFILGDGFICKVLKQLIFWLKRLNFCGLFEVFSIFFWKLNWVFRKSLSFGLLGLWEFDDWSTSDCDFLLFSYCDSRYFFLHPGIAVRQYLLKPLPILELKLFFFLGFFEPCPKWDCPITTSW